MLGNIARSSRCWYAVYICTVRTGRMGETVFEAGFAIFSLLHMQTSPRA